MRHHRTLTPVAIGMVVLGALLVGFWAGQLWSARPVTAAQATPQPATNTPGTVASPVSAFAATATRVAEELELDFLRAQASQTPPPVVCTPPPVTPTVTPTPTVLVTLVPPVASGQPRSYRDDWTVTVTGLSLVPSFAGQTAEGTFAKVDLTITNDTEAARVFPYGDLVLRDAQGRAFLPDPVVAAQNEAGFFSVFPPSLPTPGFVIFDIAADAGETFVLESTTDPTFRVEVSQARSG